MKRIIRTIIVLIIALIAMLSTMVALASGPSVTFTKVVSNTTPHVGEVFTITLQFANTYTAPLQVQVSDPNPAPAYLSILSSTITGGAAYSPTINAVVWAGSLNVGSLPQQVKFQMLVTGIPTAAIESGYPVTNTAYMVDVSSTGSLPNQTASASILIRPEAQSIPLNTSDNPDGSITLNTAVDTVVEDTQLRIELQPNTIISATNIPPGGVQLAYTPNHTSNPTDTGLPFANRRFVLELVAQTPPYTPITPVTFNPPIILRSFYDPTQLAAANILPAEINIQYRNASSTTWLNVPEADIIERGAGTTTANSYVEFMVGHLTEFALVGPIKLYLPIISRN